MTAAVFLREKLGASPAEIEGALTAVAVVQRFLEAQRAAAAARDGHGDGPGAGGAGDGAPA
jgi:hypothetical protein